MYSGEFNVLYPLKIISFGIAKLQPGEGELPQVIEVFIPYPNKRKKNKGKTFADPRYAVCYQNGDHHKKRVDKYRCNPADFQERIITMPPGDPVKCNLIENKQHYIRPDKCKAESISAKDLVEQDHHAEIDKKPCFKRRERESQERTAQDTKQERSYFFILRKYIQD